MEFVAGAAVEFAITFSLCFPVVRIFDDAVRLTCEVGQTERKKGQYGGAVIYLMRKTATDIMHFGSIRAWKAEPMLCVPHTDIAPHYQHYMAGVFAMFKLDIPFTPTTQCRSQLPVLYSTKRHFIRVFGICAIVQQMLWTIQVTLPVSLTNRSMTPSIPSWQIY